MVARNINPKKTFEKRKGIPHGEIPYPNIFEIFFKGLRKMKSENPMNKINPANFRLNILDLKSNKIYTK